MMASDSSTHVSTPLGKTDATIADYIRIARFDHGAKHIFILPGLMLAYLLRRHQVSVHFSNIVLGFVAAVCIASANYVINEWLDQDFDQYHPTKSKRTAVQKRLRGSMIALEWCFFAAVGLTSAYLSSRSMALVAFIFALQGLFYNVPPVRTKDRPYLDVISESINNPLRLMIGWAMVDSEQRYISWP
jgi:4-hydroxybenzoate polyprenyltransferase